MSPPVRQSLRSRAPRRRAPTPRAPAAPLFAPTVNDPAEADFAAGVCAALVGADRVERNPPLIIASEDFSFMLEQVPGCYLNIGNGAGEGACEVHNPRYDFNDAALPLGAAFFVGAVQAKLAR